MNVIETRDLGKSYRRVRALEGVNLDVPEGSVYALVGSNGAGKTTALQTLLNLQTPSRGTATVLECDSRRLSPKQFARLGYVSENQELPEWMTTGNWLKYLAPLYPTWDRAWARDLVRRFDLPLERKLRHLSRGMRVKAALAAALAFHPRLLVLDEPFTGLDALVRDQLIEALLGECENATVLISSHDLAEIESFASHVGYLESGHLRFSEELPSLAARFREIEVGFDSPPVLPSPLPRGWLHATTGGTAVRFIHTRFNAEVTPLEVRQALPGAVSIEAVPMPLRAIFVALAKAGGEQSE